MYLYRSLKLTLPPWTPVFLVTFLTFTVVIRCLSYMDVLLHATEMLKGRFCSDPISQMKLRKIEVKSAADRLLPSLSHQPPGRAYSASGRAE